MDYTDKIDKGVAYLKEEHDEWLRTVNVDKLDMSHPRDCILGQLHGYFGEYLFDHAKGLTWAVEHGFTTFTDEETGTNYPDLTWQWQVRINDLRLELGEAELDEQLNAMDAAGLDDEGR